MLRVRSLILRAIETQGSRNIYTEKQCDGIRINRHKTYIHILWGDEGKHDLDNGKGRKQGTREESEGVIWGEGTNEGREGRE